MTENEAIKELKEAIECCTSGEDEHFKEALGMGILAIEEIQQYRAIGMVEEIQLKIDALKYDCTRYEEQLSIARGEKQVFTDDDMLLEEYRAIGTIEEFKALKEKNTKKRFNIFESHGMRQFVCGCCDRPILTTDNYCSFCGQKLDWQ